MADCDFEINYEYLARLGVSNFRGAQREVVYNMLCKDSNILAVMPTGSGKTLCFQYYSLVVKNLVIIIYPLVSLINDQKRRFDKAGIPCAVLKGGQTKSQRRAELEKLRSKKANVVITNPETLIGKRITAFLSDFDYITLIADESHTLIEWGRSFRYAMLKISYFIDKAHVKKVVAFTATLSHEVERGLEDVIFRKKGYERIYASANRENIKYLHYMCSSRSYMLYNILKKAQRPCIIFANDRKLTEKISQFVTRFFPNIDTRFYHAGLSKDKRCKIEDWFYKSDDGILAATCAFGMGVDKSDIRSVIHLKLPDCVSSFLQESGRAGRDGCNATSYSIIHYSELNNIIKNGTVTKRDELIKCFVSQECTRISLLKILGESGEGVDCPSACSTCSEKSVDDIIYTLVLDIVKKYRKVFSKNELIFILKGIRLYNIPLCSNLAFFAKLKELNIAFITEFVESALSECKFDIMQKK